MSLTIEDCCGSWGIRTPGTINSYGSLANCWFQPLTQTSLPIIFIVSFSLKRGAKVRRFFYISKYFRTFFSKKLNFLCFSLENGSFWPVLPLFLIFCSCSYALLGKVLFGSKKSWLGILDRSFLGKISEKTTGWRKKYAQVSARKCPIFYIYIIRYIWDVWSIDGQKEWGRGDEKESRQRLPLMESLRLSCLFLQNESLYVCLFCRNILQNLQQMSPNHVDGGDEQALDGSMHIAQRRSERNHVEVGITL